MTTCISTLNSEPTRDSSSVTAASVTGDAMDGSAFTASHRVFPCPHHVYLQLRGEVAERLKAAVC